MTSVAVRSLEAVVFAQRHRFFLWVPVWLGCGIGLYFSLPRELTWGEVLSLCGAVLALLILIVRLQAILRVLLWPFVLLGLGLVLAQARAHLVAAPKFETRNYGAVEGDIVGIDRSASDRIRVTLSDIYISGRAPKEMPRTVRISFHGNPGTALTPGARIAATAHLSPPQGPVEPGGFDFQRKAWFDRLGAVGYARAPPVRVADPAPRSWRAQVFGLRLALSQALRDRMPDQAGAFAAAILVGDRSAIDPGSLADLRRSNLAHLLAISGLHMGLLTGLVFASLRIALAAVPPIALRWPIKKIAALAAILTALGYLFMSGASIATQRAFVMVTVMLIAVVLDRPALSLRAVAMAAVLILCVRPESLTEPGFQMSFAATTALVAVFEQLAKSRLWLALARGRLGFLRNAASLFVASLVAGLATAPFSAFHFNQIAHFGLIANLASVPVMGLIVMPSALLGLALLPFGLETAPLWAMGLGIDWILAVASWVSALPDAVSRVPSVATEVLALLVLGVLTIILWVGHARWLGAVPAAVALVFWSHIQRPDVLVDQTGRLVGVLEPEGRTLSRDKGAGFAARNWLENDGDGRSQVSSYRPMGPDDDQWFRSIGGQVIAYSWDKAAPDFERLCALADLVLVPRQPAAPCRALTSVSLAHSGAVALYVTDAGIVQKTVRAATGERLWNQ